MAGSVAPHAVVLGLLLLVGLAAAQRGTTPAAVAPAPNPGCNGIQLTYNFVDRTKIRPFVSDKNKQPYAFRTNVTVLNSGTRPLKSWVGGTRHIRLRRDPRRRRNPHPPPHRTLAHDFTPNPPRPPLGPEGTPRAATGSGALPRVHCFDSNRNHRVVVRCLAEEARFVGGQHWFDCLVHVR